MLILPQITNPLRDNRGEPKDPRYITKLGNTAPTLSNGPILIVSDNPEDLTDFTRGVLWRTRISKAEGPANVRLYLYHVNSHTIAPKRLAVVVRNNFKLYKQTVSTSLVRAASNKGEPGLWDDGRFTATWLDI
jgi:hypothetical protein